MQRCKREPGRCPKGRSTGAICKIPRCRVHPEIQAQEEKGAYRHKKCLGTNLWGRKLARAAMRHSSHRGAQLAQ